MSNISIIIPAYNEEEVIGQVIECVKESNIDNEIIVVDNNSTDNTSNISKEKGAKVVTCLDIGKGNAMRAGLDVAKNEFVVFLDADIINYSEKIVDVLVEPLINRNVDFVKSTFDRVEGGVVTEIAIKPLLDILFPNMYKFSEPLSGMIAAKKEVLKKVEFESDYGVDIGILIDMINMGAEVEEVNIGQIVNMSHVVKNNQIMKNMSTQVMKAILKRKDSIN